MTAEPFSPSMFLDLPPTPRPDDGDDAILAYISRMLLEEEEEEGIDDHSFFHHYYPSDHPALLQAQEPFAQILSMADEGDSEEDTLNLAFQKGREEATKFLPATSSLLSSLGQGESLTRDSNNKRQNIDQDACLEEGETGRKSKLMVPEQEESSDVVDNMIVNAYGMCLAAMKGLRITMASKGKGKKNGRRSTTRNEASVDLSTLLVHCARAVAMDNRRSAAELLLQIRQHCSPSGDATQRLAHCFAQGLEARLAGSGSQAVYKSVSLVGKKQQRTSLVELLRAYRLYTAACCFNMMSYKFANMTICKVVAAGRRRKVHIVDYGINYGFQWPTLLRFMATLWEGGPPEVRITGIDLPQPGFRPAARVDATGRRLINFARQSSVPFKFHGVAAKWETICVEDLNIDPDEVLIVNSMVRFENLMDESAGMDSPSPRDVVLGNIRKMKPDVFILNVTNGSYGNPFFVTRFRELMLHYSTMFDMLDATIPRDSNLRMLVERDLFGQCALNAIACEGSDRVERPETYKQWQARNHRVGLRQLPLDPDLVQVVREKVKEQFHKDFIVDVDQRWLLKGWKGRMLYAMSTWVAGE
ncbi:unnamed protein product [Urochloa humidicola]